MSQERNISDLIKCTPSGVQERSRSILGEYIYGTGYNENSTCLEVVVKNKGGNVGQFVQKVGDYNFKAVTSETYSPPKEERYTDYNEKCPENWKSQGDGCVNTTQKNGSYVYSGSCDAGRTKKTKKYQFIRNEQRQEQYNENVAKLCNCPRGWTDLGNYACRAPWYYYGPCAIVSGFRGYSDDDKRNWGYWCRSTWDNCNQNVARTRNKEVPLYGWVDINDTEPPSVFGSEQDKKKAESRCNVKWPTKTKSTPGKWDCGYGTSIADDVNSNKIIDLGTANNYVEATAKVLKNTVVPNPKYFAISHGRVYLAKDGKLDAFSSKGNYTTNCPKNEGKVEVYELKPTFYSGLVECCNVDNSINNTLNNLEKFENQEQPCYAWITTVLAILIVFSVVIIIRIKLK